MSAPKLTMTGPVSAQDKMISSSHMSQQHRPIYPGCYPTAQAAAPGTDGAYRPGLGGIHRAVSRLLRPEKLRSDEIIVAGGRVASRCRGAGRERTSVREWYPPTAMAVTPVRSAGTLACPQEVSPSATMVPSFFSTSGMRVRRRRFYHHPHCASRSNRSEMGLDSTIAVSDGPNCDSRSMSACKCSTDTTRTRSKEQSLPLTRCSSITSGNAVVAIPRRTQRSPKQRIRI